MNDEAKRRRIQADVERRLQLDGRFHVRVLDPRGKSTEEVLAELAQFAADCESADAGPAPRSVSIDSDISRVRGD